MLILCEYEVYQTNNGLKHFLYMTGALGQKQHSNKELRLVLHSLIQYRSPQATGHRGHIVELQREKCLKWLSLLRDPTTLEMPTETPQYNKECDLFLKYT